MRILPILVVAAAACQAQGEQRGVEVVVRDDRGRVELSLTRTATGCVTDESLVIFAHSDGITAGAWSLARGPTGRELRGPQGLIARVVDETNPTNRMSILDPVGVPMARLYFVDADTTQVVDAGRTQIARIVRTEKGFSLFMGADERPARTVTGTRENDLAARLLVPVDIPDEARALFACGRLAVITPAHVK